MADTFGQNNASQNQPSAEDQIRSMRADLSQGARPVSEPQLNVPNTSAPRKPLFDADEPVFNPNTVYQPQTGPTQRVTIPSLEQNRQNASAPTPSNAPVGAPSVDDLIAKQKNRNTVVTIAGAVVGLIVLGVGAYFAVPLFMKKEVPQPTDIPEVTIPETTKPLEPTQPNEPSTPTPPTATKPSGFFMEEPAKRITINLSTPITISALREATMLNSLTEGTTELNLITIGEKPAQFQEVISVLAPNLKNQTSSLFTEELTAFAFADGEGVWPGYIGRAKPNATPAEIKAWFTELEKTNKAAFFAKDPGALQPFKNGIVPPSLPDRYAAGEKGASFSYLIIPEEKIIIVTTSFGSMKEAIRLIGL